MLDMIKASISTHTCVYEFQGGGGSDAWLHSPATRSANQVEPLAAEVLWNSRMTLGGSGAG